MRYAMKAASQMTSLKNPVLRTSLFQHRFEKRVGKGLFSAREGWIWGFGAGKQPISAPFLKACSE